MARNLVASKPAIVRPALTLEMKWPHDRGAPSPWVNRGDSEGGWSHRNRLLSAYTSQVHAAGALEMVTGDSHALHEGVSL